MAMQKPGQGVSSAASALFAGAGPLLVAALATSAAPITSATTTPAASAGTGALTTTMTTTRLESTTRASTPDWVAHRPEIPATTVVLIVIFGAFSLFILLRLLYKRREVMQYCSLMCFHCKHGKVAPAQDVEIAQTRLQSPPRAGHRMNTAWRPPSAQASEPDSTLAHIQQKLEARAEAAVARRSSATTPIVPLTAVSTSQAGEDIRPTHSGHERLPPIVSSRAASERSLPPIVAATPTTSQRLAPLGLSGPSSATGASTVANHEQSLEALRATTLPRLLPRLSPIEPGRALSLDGSNVSPRAPLLPADESSA
ncbi:uncharacterized protein MONBRDRAFT_6716 [Monosiga brevicollis MX1]|uniref:Uncharacterized protein n=1 Tax=Monosiga brevicollis TaxID=81824 RepID=A9UV34_MONBE|nr:uncharacterized protein MONBRDRAFT_6716 [Monosiga brevicollis MX1]EDQ90825.1 predicted protein [Monosiga brevicollis MX1]|eukprot:XP_001744122.1 hypothetical protein [Monosiga brevicollis MX1]